MAMANKVCSIKLRRPRSTRLPGLGRRDWAAHRRGHPLENLPHRRLPPEQANEPQGQAQEQTQEQTGYQREIETHLLVFDADVAGESAQPGEGRSEDPYQADAGDGEAQDQQHPSEAGLSVHGHTSLAFYRAGGRLGAPGQCERMLSNRPRWIQATTHTPLRIKRPAASRRRKSGSLKNSLPPMIDSSSENRWTATTSGA